MRRLLVVPFAVLAMSSCAMPAVQRAMPATPAKAAPKPPCEGDVVDVMWQRATDCDVNPPQIIVEHYPSWLAEDEAGDECDLAGGRLVDDERERFVCEDIDY